MIVKGWLHKSHRGDNGNPRKRYFVSEGFQVRYFTNDTLKSLKGHFDLRNVVGLQSEGGDAVHFQIAEGSADAVKKRIIVSFEGDASRWLPPWCSAVPKSAVAASLQSFVSEALAAQFNMTYGRQEGIGSKRRLTSGAPPVTAPLTPREALPAPVIDDTTLDTPRGGPPSSTTQPAKDVYEVTVPEAARPGDKLKMSLPGDVEAILTVPEGAIPGAVLSFEMPAEGGAIATPDEAAAIVLQARVRGLKARASTKQLAEQTSEESLEKAAVRIQTIIRGQWPAASKRDLT